MREISEQSAKILADFEAKASKGTKKALVARTAIMSGEGKVSQNVSLWTAEYHGLRREIMRFGNVCRERFGYSVLKYSSGKWSITAKSPEVADLAKAKLEEFRAKYPNVS